MSQLSGSTTMSNRVGKRKASDEFEHDAKKTMIHHQSSEKQSTATAPKPFDQPRFVSAATTFAYTPKNVETMGEMTDEEMQTYTIEFEKTHPQ